MKSQTHCTVYIVKGKSILSMTQNLKDVTNIVLLYLFNVFFAMSTPKTNYMCFFLLQNALIDLFSSWKIVCAWQHVGGFSTASQRREAPLYSTCFQTRQRDYEWISFQDFACYILFYKGWTTVVRTGWMTSHACTWTLHAGGFHTTYSYRMSSKSNAVCHWCPDVITGSVNCSSSYRRNHNFSQTLDVASFYSYVLFLMMMMMSKKLNSITLDCNNKGCVTWQKWKVLFFALSLWLTLRTLVFNELLKETHLGQRAERLLGSNTKSRCSVMSSCLATSDHKSPAQESVN